MGRRLRKPPWPGPPRAAKQRLGPSGIRRAESVPRQEIGTRTMPSKNNPSASKEVPTGRRMKGPEMFMRADRNRLRLILRKPREELLRPQPALTEQSDL